MPKVGDKEFPYTSKGIQEAAKESSESGIPVSDAGNRAESYQLGGLIPGQLGFGKRPIGSYKEGGKIIKHVYPDGSWYEGPDTPEGRKRIKDEEFYQKNVQPGIDKEKAKAKAKAEAESKAKAKTKKKEDIKKSQARDKKDVAAGSKKYGPHWAQGELEDMGGGRE